MAAKKKKPAKKAVRKKPAKKKNASARSRGAETRRAEAQTSYSHAVNNSHELPAQLWRRSHYKTLREFWPFYLHEHSFGLNRILHFIGSTLGLVILAIAIGTRKYWLILPALVCGYAFAWVGHFFIEKNRPATFKYPLKSFISDWRMWYYILTGKVVKEMERFGISNR